MFVYQRILYMAVFLTILLSTLSLGILAGRVYEILNLTDAATGFFYYKGIVFTPHILLLFLLTVVCCGIIIFGDRKDDTPFFSHSSRIIAVAAGAMLVVFGVMSRAEGISFVFSIAGGAALVLLGIFELHNKGGFADILISVLIVVFVAGLSLDAIVFDVYTINNIHFTQKALGSVCASLFFMAMMKNIFAPAAKSRMLLYITGMLAAVMCGVMSVADIICMAVTDAIVLPDLFFSAGFAFLGFFAFDNAISALPASGRQKCEEDEDLSEENDVKLYTKSEKTENIHNTTGYSEENTATENEGKAVRESKEFDLSLNKEFTQFFTRIEEKSETPEKDAKKSPKYTFRASKNDSGKVVYKKPK